MRSETFNTNAKIANDLKTKRVSELNDKLREMIFKDVKAINKELKSWLYAQPIKDKIVITPGINALTNQQQLYIFNRVKNFKDFNKGDDPYGEKDFGAFNNEEDIKIFWKIDYYDNNLKYHSEDKSDPDKTTRVLTIMLASEY